MQKNPDKSVFEINNRYPVTKKLHDGADILIFDDFLKKPDAYKEILQRFPAFTSDYFEPTASPGWRQLIPYQFFLNIEKLLKNYTGYYPWVEQSFTNIYRSKMPCNCKAWYPHHDSMEYVLNLWLCNGPGGTAFYTWRNHFSGEDFPPHIRERVFNKQLPGEFEYEEFYGDSEWNQYHLEPIVYNRAIFYNGNNFHSAFVPDDYPDWRYSLMLMGGLDRNE
tara:strand:+ start:460 stop:1122 length:663 start_codon:yes stop_codon:yes gene_type:complete